MNNSLPVSRFEPHRARLLGLARGWLGNHADAQDAVQDVWLRVQSGVPPGLDSDAGWLVTVLRHLCVDRLRRRQRESRELLAWAAIDHDQSEPSAEHVATRALETRAALRRLLPVLSADDLAALLLHVVFDFEHGEIAQLVGQTEPAMRQRVHRARRRARSRLANLDADADADADESSVSPAQEALLSLCWRAVHGHDAAALIVQLRPAFAPAIEPTAMRASTPRVASASGVASAAPRSSSQVVQVDGVLGLAWILDGVVLCTVPMGPVAMQREDRVAA